MRRQHSAVAVVIGLDTVQGLQAARILASRGVPVVALARDRDHYCCKTRVCREIVVADTDTEAFIGTLEQLGPKLSEKAVLFPAEDQAMLLVSRHRERLAPWFHVVLPAPEIVEMLSDKLAFYRYCEASGFPVTRTFYLDSPNDLESALRAATFPCILKPSDSAEPRWENNTDWKARKVSDGEQLRELYRTHAQWADKFVLQEWIEGADANIAACFCYFNRQSEPLVTFVARKLRQWPPQTGQGCLSEECRDDFIRETTLRLYRSVQFYGMGNLEMKRDNRTGKYFAVEPNFGRAMVRQANVEAGGVELFYTMYCDAIGAELPPNRQQLYQGAKWIHLRRDLMSAWYYWRRGELTLAEWWRSMQGINVDAVFSWRDPGPFLHDILRMVRVLLTPKSRRGGKLRGSA